MFIYIIKINLIYSDIINLLLINNYYTKKILQYYYHNVIDDKVDYELLFLRKKALLLLNENNQEFNINNCFESYIKICNLYFHLNEFIINERIDNSIYIDINYINNIINYINHIVYIDNYEFSNIYNFHDLLYNNNNIINIYNQVYNQIISLYNNNNKIISFDFYVNNPINNNNFQNNHNLLNDINSIENEIKNNDDKNINYLELKDNMKVQEPDKKIINKKRSYIKRKRNIFKVITKISRYRGVTKNKKKWQVYIRINSKNTYLGSYKSEIIAAKIYDIMAIKKKGNNAKTNFKYDSKQIEKVSKLKLSINNLFKIASKKLI